MSTNMKATDKLAAELYEGAAVEMKSSGLTPEEVAAKLYRYDNIAPYLESLEDITPEKLREYKERGFLAVRSVFNSEETKGAVEALMGLIFEDSKGARVQFSKPQAELKSNEEREWAVRKVHEFVGKDETLTAIAHHPELLKALRNILGEEPVLVQDMALLKPPHGGGEKPWHQDMAYGPLAFDKPVVGVWIALDEAALDNGCMHVIPRSHMEGGVPHYAVRDWQICDTNVSVDRDVAVPLPVGGALFFHGMLHHGTPPNHSVKRRRALQFHYACASSVKIRPDEYKRIYTNAMTDAEC